MNNIENKVYETLKNLKSVDKLSELFCSHLNYEYSGNKVSYRGWKENITDPIRNLQLLAKHNDFQIILCEIDRFLLGTERPIINQLLKDHPYCLVVFTEPSYHNWHFVNIKYDEDIKDRRLFRRIVIGPDERFHTAAQRISMLEVVSEEISPLELQTRHDEAFDVDKVTKEFYTTIALKFTELVGGERQIGKRQIIEKGSLKLPSTDNDTIKKEFVVRLIGRLVFCWFLKKKKSNNGIPLLSEEILSSNSVGKYKNYYHTILEPLFFEVLNNPIEKRKKDFRDSLWSNIPFSQRRVISTTT